MKRNPIIRYKCQFCAKRIRVEFRSHHENRGCSGLARSRPFDYPGCDKSIRRTEPKPDLETLDRIGWKQE